MPRLMISAALIAITFTPLISGVVHADDPGQYMGYNAYPQPQQYAPPVGPSITTYPGYASYADGMPPVYPELDASLYPCPRPDIPAEVGGTVITNPAMYPHEMLYPHTYKTIYPPFYYKYKRQFGLYPCNLLYFRNPFVRKVPVIRGTEVTVEYRGYISPSALYFPPSGLRPLSMK